MSTNKNSRRAFIGVSALGTALAAYSWKRGLRIPPLSWEPKNPSSTATFNRTTIDLVNSIFTSQGTGLSIRAYAPQPTIRLSSTSKSEISFKVLNIFPAAELSVTGNSEVVETIEGINRNIDVKISDKETLELTWNLPPVKTLRFAAIGDTGGGKELSWCIHRAHKLGAQFLLHLGDINYTKGDFESAFEIFRNAEIPSFISIGNHDFHDQGPKYQFFLENFGPLNFEFTMGDVRFINVDTASNFLPYDSGHRGRILSLSSKPSSIKQTIAFTHRPLFDPVPESDHHIGSVGETNWIIGALKNIGANTLLSGHIHISDRSTIEGIDNLIAGQGLGHQDLLTNSDSSEILIGTIDDGGELDLDFHPLAMPMSFHCHPRLAAVKASTEHRGLISRIENECKEP